MYLPEMGSLPASGGWVKSGVKPRDSDKVEKALNSHLLKAVGFGPNIKFAVSLSRLFVQ